LLTYLFIGGSVVVVVIKFNVSFGTLGRLLTVGSLLFTMNTIPGHEVPPSQSELQNRASGFN